MKGKITSKEYFMEVQPDRINVLLRGTNPYYDVIASIPKTGSFSGISDEKILYMPVPILFGKEYLDLFELTRINGDYSDRADFITGKGIKITFNVSANKWGERRRKRKLGEYIIKNI